MLNTETEQIEHLKLISPWKHLKLFLAINNDTADQFQNQC